MKASKNKRKSGYLLLVSVFLGVVVVAVLGKILFNLGVNQSMVAGVDTSNLLFSDEFDGTSLAAQWYAMPIWYTYDQKCASTDTGASAEWEPNAVSLSGGYLKLTASKLSTPCVQADHTDRGTRSYKSGWVQTGGYAYNSTVPKRWFTYGYFEARLKCPDMLGSWCAFWLWAEPNSGAEIDITETLANQPDIHNMNLHGVTTFSKTYNLLNLPFPNNVPNNEWHTYAVDWQKGYVKWYVDNTLTSTYTGTAFDGQSLYAILNLQTGTTGSWAGKVDESKLPATMSVDWVHVYSVNPYNQSGTVTPTTTLTSTPTSKPTPTSTSTPTPTPTSKPTPTSTSTPTLTPVPTVSTKDVTAPVVLVSTPTSGMVVNTYRYMEIKSTASDAVGVTVMRVYLDGTRLKTCYRTTVCNSSKQVSRIGVGAHKITVQAWDRAGNVGTKSVGFVKQ